MKNIYIVETHNQHKQLLIFTSKKAAIQWAQKATTWNAEQINSNIKAIAQAWQGFYSIFPTEGD